MLRRNEQTQQISVLFLVPFVLGGILAALDLLIFFLYWPAGLLILAFLVGYFALIAYLYLEQKSIMTREMVQFALEYEDLENHILKDTDQSLAILDQKGRVLWTNRAFDVMAESSRGISAAENLLGGRPISSMFQEIRQEALPHDENTVRIPVHRGDRELSAQIRRVPMEGMAAGNRLFGETGMQDYVMLLNLKDVTAVRLAVQEVDDQSMAAGFIYIDNYEEALESLEEVKRSLLVALIDRKVSRYILSYDGLCSKIEKDKFLIVLRKKQLRQIMDGHFSLLEDVKTVNIGNEMALTLSIGIGLDGLTYAQNYEFARNAVELALGRGGDQAAVKTPDNVVYYGGKTLQAEKNTRVRARVKAQAMKEILRVRDNVFIMGHKLGDPDSFGAAIGIYRIARTLNKKAFIVLNERNTSLRSFLALFEKNPEYEDKFIINSEEALMLVSDNDALVVVDVNQPSRTECPSLLELCKSIVVLDHHRTGKEVIENATLSYVEPYASSACELVSEILQYVGENIRIRPEEADVLYGGIVVDTHNFVGKAGVRTFEAAAFLRRSGADVTRVRKLLRENAEDYKAKADTVSQAEIYRTAFAFSVCRARGLDSPTVIGAQAANDLLDIRGVKASFVFTEYENKVYISARSIDEVNVQVILEKVGGGGHMTIAGSQLEGVTVQEAQSRVRKVIDDMIRSGQLTIQEKR